MNTIKRVDAICIASSTLDIPLSRASPSLFPQCTVPSCGDTDKQILKLHLFCTFARRSPRPINHFRSFFFSPYLRSSPSSISTICLAPSRRHEVLQRQGYRFLRHFCPRGATESTRRMATVELDRLVPRRRPSSRSDRTPKHGLAATGQPDLHLHH